MMNTMPNQEEVEPMAHVTETPELTVPSLPESGGARVDGTDTRLRFGRWPPIWAR